MLNFRPRRFHRIAALSLGSLGLLVACDVEDFPEPGSVEFRKAHLSIKSEVLDPVPGGGGCEGCVTCFARSAGGKVKNMPISGKMCIKPAVRYVGSRVGIDDDSALEGLLTSAQEHESAVRQWQLFAASDDSDVDKGESLCVGEACWGKPGNTNDKTKLIFDLLDLLPRPTFAPAQIQFQLSASPEAGPTIDISEDLGAVPVEPPVPAPSAPHVDPGDVNRGAMAHITYAAEGGGMHSCSGFLLSSRHVLTAAHCFVRPDLLEKDSLEDLPSSSMDVEDVRVRIGGLHAPGHPNFPDGAQRTAVRVHFHENLDVDLALLELAEPSCAAPFRLLAPAADPQSPRPDRFFAYGYGVAGLAADASLNAYDWGRLKRTKLQRGQDGLRELFADPDGILTFIPPWSGIGVCHGDSGGPVVATVAGVDRVVGVMIARIVHEKDQNYPTQDAIEMIASRGFAWSRHNACGRPDPRAYAAARLDTGPVQAWMADVIGTPESSACPRLPVEPPGELPVELPVDPPLAEF